jgi:3-hydroxyacyl-CoA dehydrogenase/enoyl-CoA hydratase/3-hydroxybutyryl-CoA epimerase
MIHYRKDKYGIVTLTLDMSKQSVNTINQKIAQAFIPVLEYLEADKALKGVIISSAKTSFLAGGDLDFLHQADHAQEIFQHTDLLVRIFRRIELLKVPVVAAINGAALGSGFEFTLACHYRIALDTPKTILGLPEVSLGMIPGGGGIIRLMWMLGLRDAFNIISNSKLFHVKEALQKGLIDEIVTNEQDLVEAARAWILSKPDITKPWDSEDHIAKSSNPKHPKTAKMIADLTARVIRKTLNNYPAVLGVLNTMAEGAVVDFDAATRINARYFTAMILSKDCRNQTKAFWYDINKIRNGISRPKGFGRFRARRIGIIGTGLMGSGIAYASALEGIEVVLKDVSKSIAEQGKDYARGMLERIVRGGKMTEAQAEEILDRIHTTDQIQEFENCDLVIEAVYENAELKKRIINETEKHLHQHTFFATNTASLQVSDLAEACIHPENYVGMHFFAPVQSIPLVEVIRGRKTSDESIARAFDFVLQIGKTPIIVKDSPAFFVSRVASSYLMEGIRLLKEGQSPAMIENAALQAGFPLGPLAFADKLGFRYILSAEEQAAKQMGDQYKSPIAIEVLKDLVKMQRYGKSRKAGFYDYNNGKVRLWSALQEQYPPTREQLSLKDIQHRLLFVQCIEAVHCMEESVVANNYDANLGSIYGWGFPSFKGGVIQYMNDFGIEEFVLRAKELAKKFGDRFQVPATLETMAVEQTNFL